MYVVRVGETFEDFRDVARRLLAVPLAPADVRLTTGTTQTSLLETPWEPGEATARIDVPKRFVELAQEVALHREPERWNTLYRVLWRMSHGERRLLENELDDDTRQLQLWSRDVRHDLHKAEAFVRFREVKDESGAEHFIAWHRSDHRILSKLAEFFRRRLPAMRWSILTPDGSAHWDPAGKSLTFGAAVSKEEAPDGDALESLWRQYYSSTFNPARANEKMMRKEMPQRYWGSLPEASLIPGLLHAAERRTAAMTTQQRESSESEIFLPPLETRSLASLAAALPSCRACPLYAPATQAVCGEGPQTAALMFVGEQPGDNEDRTGRPFVGPAGQLFDDLLLEAGIDRTQAYVTNAVKHFKHEVIGTQRIHQKPDRKEVVACRGWLEAEVQVVQPRVIVCLGATASQAFLGAAFKLLVNRGERFDTPFADHLLVTLHPSALLRADPARSEQMRAAMLTDLRRAKALLEDAGTRAAT